LALLTNAPGAKRYTARVSGAKREFVDGRVRDVVASGDAVIETALGVVFARGGLPGEQVRVSLEPKSGRLRRGRISDVLTPSSARVVPPCRYVARCGGCALMHASEDEQQKLRAGFLRGALLKAGVPEQLSIGMTRGGASLGYRRRARLAFRRGPSALSLGFRRERSHDLVDLDVCVVLTDVLNRALTRLREGLAAHLQGEGELSLAHGRRGAAVVVVNASGTQPPQLYAACEQLVDGSTIEGVALFAGGASKPALFGDPSEWSEALDGSALEGTVGGFSQAYAEINRALIARVVELAQTRDARVLELYAGTGNFTVALAPGALSYTAVEQAPAAVSALRRNLAARKIAAKVVEGDVVHNLAGGPLDVVVLDPPRTGAASVLTALALRKPRRIVYVSCDPATLARDLRELLPRGYTLAHAEAFEMFPHTPDLESIVLLERSR
jgi:23S rRNA (uracil1939-C5)-methyltransferase